MKNSSITYVGSPYEGQEKNYGIVFMQATKVNENSLLLILCCKPYLQNAITSVNSEVTTDCLPCNILLSMCESTVTWSEADQSKRFLELDSDWQHVRDLPISMGLRHFILEGIASSRPQGLRSGDRYAAISNMNRNPSCWNTLQCLQFCDCCANSFCQEA